jgi:hypothetical protein
MDKEEIVAAGAPAGGNETISTGQETQDLIIPENWDQTTRDYLGTLSDPIAKKTYFDRAKDLEDRYGQKNDSFAKERKAFEDERGEWQKSRAEVEVWDDFVKGLSANQRDSIKESYGSIAGYLAHLRDLDQMAETDQDGFVATILQSYGITAENAAEKIAELLGGNAGIRIDTKKQMTDLEKRVEEKITREFNQRKAEAEFHQFVNATDATGAPLYPYFEQVRSDMAVLLGAYKNEPLDKLYDRAVRMRPELTAAASNAAALEKDAAKKAVATGIPESKISGSPAKAKESSTDFFLNQLKNHK